MKKEYQLFIPTFRVKETLEEIQICLEEGWTGLGFKTLEFEKAFIEYSNLANAHFLTSATAGLHLAVKILKKELGWNDGDEIISTPLTFVSTNHAILYENMRVVFADVDEYLSLDPRSVEEKITSKTRAVMFVGLGGNVGNYEKIIKLCKKYNLRLILDAAHMSGTKLNGKHVGGEADVAIFSFQAVKNLPTADSGMICFQDNHYDEISRKLSWLGISKDTYSRTHEKGSYKWYYDVEYLGYKAHGNSIMAAMGLVALKYLEKDNEYRRIIATWYDELFNDHPQIKTIPIPKNCESSRHLYQVMVEDRDKVMVELNNRSIYPGVHYRTNTKYKMYSYAENKCPRADYASDHIISLPIHLRLKREDVEYISNNLIEITEG